MKQVESNKRCDVGFSLCQMNQQKGFGVKFSKLSFVLIFGLQLSSTAFAVPDQSIVDRENFSVGETRNFVALDEKGESSVVMKAADVPEEFQCPLFSNSPYADILSALDRLENTINVFPKCGATDKTNDLLSDSSVDLRKKILEAQSLQGKGETRKLGVSAHQIIDSAMKMQDLMGTVTSSSQGDCYKTTESRNLIFSVNDTFQSIAPLALDLATKNPTLAPILAQYLPAVAGAKAVSKGLSILETALKYAPTLDMSISDNRKNVIKNTCSFVKLYRKVEYLNLDRALRIKKINDDFQKKIEKSLKIQSTFAGTLTKGMSISSSPVDTEITKIKVRGDDYRNLLARANEELATQKNTGSEISTCSVVKTIYGMKTSSKLLADLVKVASLLNRENQIAFKKTKLEEFENEMNRPDTLKNANTCAEKGQGWILAQSEALAEMQSILNDYDSQVQMTPLESIAKVKLSREKQKELDIEEDKRKSLFIMDDLSVFEPSELGKRMREMPKYLFNGPDGSLWSKAKKNGPIFDLLHNNEISFQAEMTRFNNNVAKLQTFELDQFLKEGKSAEKVTTLKKYSDLRNSFPHLSNTFARRGSDDHRDLCNYALMAITAYVFATDHLISSESFCEMATPVLKEAEVSVNLRNYCLSSKTTFLNQPQRAGYLELAKSLFGRGGPMEQVEVIMKKYKDMSCVQ